MSIWSEGMPHDDRGGHADFTATTNDRLSASTAPDTTMQLPFDAVRLVALRRVGRIAMSPDGTWIAVAVQRLNADGAAYVNDLWRLPTDGGSAVQLTRGEHNDSSPCFRSDSALGFLSNRPPLHPQPDDDSKERAQVWMLPAEGGEPYQLTDEPLGVEAFQFARHGDRMLCMAPVLLNQPYEKQRELMRERRKNGPSALRFTQQPVRYWDHWLPDGIATPMPHLIAYAQDGTGRRDLTPGALREHLIEPEFSISPDGRRAALTSARLGVDRIDDVLLTIIDLDSGSSQIAYEAAGTEVDSPVFSPNSKRIACTVTGRSIESVGKPTLTLIDLDSGAATRVAEHWDRWPMPSAWMPDGNGVIVSADDDGCTPVFRIDVATSRVDRLTAIDAGGSHADLHVTDDGRIAGVRSTLVSPPEVFILEPLTPTRFDGSAQMNMLAPLSGFHQSHTVVVEDLRVRSTDGAVVQSWIVKPAHSEGPLPVLFAIHGGPIGSFGDGWHWRWNALLWANAGYMVVLPNARGSTGFGQEFIQGIWRNQWGAQCYRDLMAVADAIETRPDVDRGRIAALGGSFGGYMTNWIGGNTDRFKALATHASVFSMSAFTGVTDHPAYWLLEMGGTPYHDDVQDFDRYSPARFVQNWKSPTLIIHGERDYRCPIGEGLALFEALQHFGVESELVVFPDENHWIMKPKNIVAWNAALLDFFSRHL